jgi:hypothetical protein
MNKIKNYYLVLEIPPSGEDFDNGIAFDYPKNLPIPRVNEKIIYDLYTKTIYKKD